MSTIICNKCKQPTRLVRDEEGEKRSKELNKWQYQRPYFFALCCEHLDCDNHLFDEGFYGVDSESLQKTYVHDICVRCGKIVKGGNQND